MPKVLITGANGQLGCSLRKRVPQSWECRFTDVAELNLCNEEDVMCYVADFHPDYVLNCAAYTQVERAEEEPQKAYEINCLGVRNLAKVSQKVNAVLVHISTDYVFDGEAHMPYVETQETHPINVYGETKLAGEKAIEEVGGRYVILRTAWLYSEYGNNFLKTMIRLSREREELQVVVDQIGSPTYAGDLAEAMIKIVEMGWQDAWRGIYHFTNEGVASWYDFTVEIACLVGHECHIKPCRTEDYPTKAQRPHYSVLDKSKFGRTFGVEIPHWTTSLKKAVEELEK